MDTTSKETLNCWPIAQTRHVRKTATLCFSVRSTWKNATTSFAAVFLFDTYFPVLKTRPFTLRPWTTCGAFGKKNLTDAEKRTKNLTFLIIVWWVVWIERNSFIFRDRLPTPSVLLDRAKRLLHAEQAPSCKPTLSQLACPNFQARNFGRSETDMARKCLILFTSKFIGLGRTSQAKDRRSTTLQFRGPNSYPIIDWAGSNPARTNNWAELVGSVSIKLTCKATPISL